MVICKMHDRKTKVRFTFMAPDWKTAKALLIAYAGGTNKKASNMLKNENEKNHD